MSLRKRILICVIFVAAIAGGYAWALAHTPRFLMSAVIARTVNDTGSANRFNHLPRMHAGIRRVVRPSPDFLYSSCAFDTSNGPVQISADVPEDNYWSASGYGDDTENFFSLNDREIGEGRIKIIILPSREDAVLEGEDLDSDAHTYLVRAPSDRGIVLIRTLIEDETREDELNETRRLATCAPLNAR